MGRSAVVLCVVLVSTGVAIADSVEDARQRILNAAMEKAMRDSETLPPISEKAFVKWWRPTIAALTASVCACDFGDKRCGRLAMDEFTIDLAEVMFRLPGVRDGITNAKDAKDAGTYGRDFTADILNRHVSAKEQLRVQARLERCVNHAIGTKFAN